MKRFIIYASLAVTLAAGGCKKYLDKEPDNRTNITTPDQIAQLLTTAYPKSHYIMFTEAMSDNAEDKNGGGSGYEFADRINRSSYRWEVVEVAPEDLDGPDAYFNACYKAIAAANQALKIIQESENQNDLQPHRGEALLARAYNHFMLVTLFAKVYDPNTAASDPGIPFVTEPETEVFVKYDRGTVASVYENIERDLVEGLPLINDAIYREAPRFHFNKQAAAAFAARFYLFKRDYANVVKYASQALSSNPAENLRPWNSTFGNLEYYELQAEYTKSQTPGNLLLQETNSIWGRSYASMRYGMGDQVVNQLFASPNVTGGYFAYDIYGANPQVYNIPKFYEHFVRESINANSGDPYNTIPLFTAEEALLNRAEAYVVTNNQAAAITDLNAFASKNIDSYNASQHNITAQKLTSYYGMGVQPALLNAVLDFKRAFFVHEGMRWFDILRWNIPVLHTTSEGEQLVLPAGDNRRVLQLPALTQQAGLEPNPR
jgi:hypothetical protein